MAKKRFNAMGQLVCRVSGGYRSSHGLTTVLGIRATTKARAKKVAKRVWRRRKEPSRARLQDAPIGRGSVLMGLPMKSVEMLTDALMQAAAKELPHTLATAGESSIGDELSIRADRLSQLIYEANEQGDQQMRSVQSVTGKQALAVLTVLNAPSPTGAV